MTIAVRNYWQNKGDDTIRKSYYLHTDVEENCDLDALNTALKNLGLNLDIIIDRNQRKRLIIDFNKDLLTPINGNDGILGRHRKQVDFDAITRMQAEGMTNKQIYEQLGITRSTFYLKMKEYRQNS